MTGSDRVLIDQAREAFDRGDHSRGGKIVHTILKRDINHAEAWSLLYTFIGRGKGFDDFQEKFVSSYYPKKYQEFLSNRPVVYDGPYHRVALVRAPEVIDEEKNGQLDFSRPKTGPVPDSRKIESSEPENKTKSSRFKLPQLFKRGKKNKGKKKAGNDVEQPRRTASIFAGLKSLFIKVPDQVRPITSEALEQKISIAMPIETPVVVEPEAPTPPLAPIPVEKSPLFQNIATERPPLTEPAKTEKRSSHTKPMLSALGQRDEIRIVIADDIRQMRENIRKLLLFEPSINVVGVAANGRQAIDLAIETQPDIVLLDINMPDLDGLQALKILREQIPLTQVIMLTVQDDPGYLREALQLGARDYLIKPPMIDDLLNTIRKAFEVGRNERERLQQIANPPISKLEEATGRTKGYSIAVYSPKGGVGCSTIAANLAVELSSPEETVVVVDCNLQYGGIGLLFNEAVRTSVADLAEIVNELDTEIVEEACVVHEASGVRLLLAPNRLGKGENVNGDQISDLVKFLTTIFSYVIVDTSSLLDDLTIGVLEAVDQVLLLTTQDIPSINDIRRMLDIAPSIGVAPDKISLVVNQYHPRISITPEKISSNLNREIFVVIPLDSPVVVPSINRGLPFVSSKQSQARPIGLAIKSLSEQIVAIAEMFK